MSAVAVAIGVGVAGVGVAGSMLQGKPSIPNAPFVNPQQDQLTNIQGNINALPSIETLAGKYNAFNQQQITQMLRSSIPMYDQLSKGVSSNIDDMLSGKIPSDVSGSIQTSAAARAVGGGFAGSGMNRNLVARDLGLTSLNLTQKGIDSASSWIKTMASIEEPGMFNVSSMFITPSQQLETDYKNQQDKFQRDYVSSLNDWQSSPGYLAGGALQSISKMGMGAMGSYLGAHGFGMPQQDTLPDENVMYQTY